MSPENLFFLDSSFIFAFYNTKDTNHARASSWYNQIKIDLPKLRFIISDYIFDELATLLLSRLDKSKAVDICEDILHDPLISLYLVSESQFNSAWDVFKKMSDKNWSFTDCTSYVVINELGIHNAAAFDRHFHQFGINVMP